MGVYLTAIDSAGSCYGLVPVSVYSGSSLVRTLSGPCSELLRKTPERGANERGLRVEGEWKESGRRSKQPPWPVSPPATC